MKKTTVFILLTSMFFLLGCAYGGGSVKDASAYVSFRTDASSPNLRFSYFGKEYSEIYELVFNEKKQGQFFLYRKSLPDGSVVNTCEGNFLGREYVNLLSYFLNFLREDFYLYGGIYDGGDYKKRYAISFYESSKELVAVVELVNENSETKWLKAINNYVFMLKRVAEEKGWCAR